MTYRSTFGRISRPTPLLFALLIMAAAAAPGAKAATYPAGFEERTLVGNLTGPTAVAWTPEGRMLVAEKAGKLKVVAPGATTPTQLLDISAKVNSYWDRGLLGIAVDSSFLANR